jgi:HPt (histidine-containing phosphotransfer) domain-containing protein
MDNVALPLLDINVLRELTQAIDPTGEKRLLQRVLHTFEASSSKLLLQAEAALLVNDWDVIGRVAHTLKSSSASIGALRLASFCAELEANIVCTERLRLGSARSRETQPESLYPTLGSDVELNKILRRLEALLQATRVTIEPLLKEPS